MKFKVEGGQYTTICYGLYNSLTEAMHAAEENTEYWDNWAGWNTPAITEANDRGEELCILPRYTKRQGEPWLDRETGEYIH